MNGKQMLFCHEYLKDQNAKQAAIRAGYSETTAQKASDWLNVKNQQKPTSLFNQEMYDYIQERLEEDKLLPAIADEREISEFLTAGFRGEIKEQVVANSGKVVEVPIGIKEQIKCAELLGKKYGMFTEKISGSLKLPVIFAGEDDLK